MIDIPSQCIISFPLQRVLYCTNDELVEGQKKSCCSFLQVSFHILSSRARKRKTHNIFIQEAEEMIGEKVSFMHKEQGAVKKLLVAQTYVPLVFPLFKTNLNWSRNVIKAQNLVRHMHKLYYYNKSQVYLE